MDPLFRAIESSAFSIWLRESTSVFAYPAFLSAHAIGMGLVVGVNVALALHLLGITPGVPTRALHGFAPVLWIGFAVNAASGVLLLLAYPTKALTNPVFLLKLTLIGIGTWVYVVLDRNGPLSPVLSRRLAVASLTAWAAAIIAGRLLAYTHHRLFVDF